MQPDKGGGHNIQQPLFGSPLTGPSEERQAEGCPASRAGPSTSTVRTPDREQTANPRPATAQEGDPRRAPAATLARLGHVAGVVGEAPVHEHQAGLVGVEEGLPRGGWEQPPLAAHAVHGRGQVAGAPWRGLVGPGGRRGGCRSAQLPRLRLGGGRRPAHRVACG